MTIASPAASPPVTAPMAPPTLSAPLDLTHWEPIAERYARLADAPLDSATFPAGLQEW